MGATVWMDDWQQQCCGETFDVGSKVTWSCVPTDGLSLTDVLGPELARTVTDREEHHGGEGTRPLTGIVRSIHAVCHDVAPRPGEHPRHFYPVPGTTVLTEVEIADGWLRPPARRGSPATSSNSHDRLCVRVIHMVTGAVHRP